jgi:hypothetical protein
VPQPDLAEGNFPSNGSALPFSHSGKLQRPGIRSSGRRSRHCIYVQFVPAGPAFCLADRAPKTRRGLTITKPRKIEPARPRK